ncbi:hypothetical protein B0I35DRAFT_484387 [Stachybotrys elegans]|uniref:Uncharacterized protein n=1 Tax=Stachybotrys elegans TaxID=80388 RepID=A0A8K0WJX2_9HYPO|nr:hypothetical protein B0I35DRAFT_484387 [Stachybotrys elegans]
MRNNPWWHEGWGNGTLEGICNQYPNMVDFEMLCTLGDNIVAIVTGQLMAIELCLKDALLSRYYLHGLEMAK